MTSYMSAFRLLIECPDGPEALEAHLDCVVEQLDEAGVIDADWTAALASGRVTINFAVNGSDFQDALAKASTLLRAAIHACEGATPRWPRVEDLGVELTKVSDAKALVDA